MLSNLAKLIYCFRSLFLNGGWFCPPGDIWQRLEIILMVTLGWGGGEDAFGA